MLVKIYRASRRAGHVAAAAWWLAGALMLPLPAAHGAEIEIAGQAGVLMETRTGRILWQRNKDLALAPASTTKILTALVVLERSKLGDFATVRAEASRAGGATVKLQAGEQLAVESLLHALLLESANDAAVALAQHVAGSVGKFVGMMNDKARGLGALQTRFRNPTGLSQKGHVTTARDLAVITRAALEHADFRKIVSTMSRPWKSAKSESNLKNTNRLLETYPGAIGVKTGHTREAGFCLVAAAQRGEETFLAVILNSSKKSGWQDAENLLDHGFKNFTALSLIEPGATVLTSRVDGRKVTIAAADEAHYVGPTKNWDLPHMEIALDELDPPIAKGEKVGEAVFRHDDKELARVDLISKVAVPSRIDMTGTLSAGAALSVLVFVLIVLLWLRRHRRRQRYIFAGRGTRLRF